MKIFRRKVNHGQKQGRTLGFPTLNFHVGRFGEHHEQGVYMSQVQIGEGKYKGALYFGLKKGDSKPVLELHVIGFSASVYGQWISFSVGQKIRGPQRFESLEALKCQIAKDVAAVESSPSHLHL